MKWVPGTEPIKKCIIEDFLWRRVNDCGTLMLSYGRNQVYKCVCFPVIDDEIQKAIIWIIYSMRDASIWSHRAWGASSNVVDPRCDVVYVMYWS